MRLPALRDLVNASTTPMTSGSWLSTSLPQLLMEASSEPGYTTRSECLLAYLR